MLLIGFVVVSAVVAVIAFFVEREPVDIDHVESEIEVGLAEQLGEDAGPYSVDCPDSMEWEPGRDFHCFAEDGVGNSSRVTVTMENDDGEWSWILG